ncbi:MAG: TonB-dependent receptor [Candidatus Azobacteroides sp.]|nr:TonB-dependent receptor [Candidatus Azobacteroides sp.]
MKKFIYLVCFLTGISLTVYAQTDHSDVASKDTISRHYTLNEVSVIGIKEQIPIEKIPASVSVINGAELNDREILSPNDLTSVVPNLYMPEYGSKITSSLYIRGLGSRMNEPAVGLYVDNAPYLDKSAFDFDLYDLASIEVLRGPQGTLYGRNSLAGIININTISPLFYQGTKILVSYGKENTFRANVSHYEKLNRNMGISLGLNYNQTDGFFTNAYTGKKADDLKSGGGRIRFDWNISDRWKLNYSFSYEYSDQDGFPYGAYDKTTGKTASVNYNDPGSYRRSLLTNSLLFRYLGNKFEMNATTSYQYFNDKMLLDQDFTPENIFTLDQKQYQNALTEEVIFKSKTLNNYQWLFGAFGFYQSLKTDVPVLFKEDGITSLINPIFVNLRDENPGMPLLQITSDSILIDGVHKTPRHGAALFHQSTFNNLLTKGLSLTLGLRFDYEKVKLDYYSTSTAASGTVQTGRGPMPTQVLAPDTISGNENMDFTELLPKVTLKYEFDNNNMIYASVAKGYKAGGYNIQIFADIMQDRMKGKPGDPKHPDESDIGNLTSYKPEYSWNYEIGGRVQPLKDHLFADASLFYIDCRDMQFVQSAGIMGRMMKNAGRTTSYGAEVSLNGVFDKFRTNISYGFTHATFKQYTDSIKNGDGTYSQINYKGNYSPMAPEHTLSIAADYTFDFKNSCIDKLIIGAQYTGAGRIYWNESNDAYQNFYGLLNGKISVVKGICQLDIWTKNVLDTDYETFYFESMGNSFAQLGKPFQIGANFMVKF